MRFAAEHLSAVLRVKPALVCPRQTSVLNLFCKSLDIIRVLKTENSKSISISMTYWHSLLFGLFQGLTEFLPVSSSGHLFLVERILKGDVADLSFVLAMHMATFLSVCVVFFKDIKLFVLGALEREKKWIHLVNKILVSLGPLVFVGLFLRPVVQKSFEKHTVAIGFFLSGLLLLSLLFMKYLSIDRKNNVTLEEMSFTQAFVIGLAQALAVLPGFSRSGWTIAVGLYCGLAPRSAVYFSFLISLPAILGSALVDWTGLFFKTSSYGTLDLLPGFEMNLSLLFAFAIAFLSGVFSVLVVLKTVQSEKLYLFAFYLLPLSVFVFFFL